MKSRVLSANLHWGWGQGARGRGKGQGVGGRGQVTRGRKAGAPVRRQGAEVRAVQDESLTQHGCRKASCARIQGSHNSFTLHQPT